MSKFSLARKLFDMDESESSDSDDSVIYISSSEDEYAEDCETDCSTDTEQLIARIEKEVTTSPMLIGGRIMTSELTEEDVLVAGPSTSRAIVEKTSKMDDKYFDLERCYAPSKRTENRGFKSATRSCQSLNYQYLHQIMKRDQVKTPF